jgi:hypothetical protein
MAEFTTYITDVMADATPAEALYDILENDDTIPGAGIITVDGEAVKVYSEQSVRAWVKSWADSYAEAASLGPASTTGSTE